MIGPGFHAVAAGQLATIVTHLERPAEDTAAAPGFPPGVTLCRIAEPGIGWYRALFRQIGENWLWFSRLAMPDAQLAAILAAPETEIWTLSRDGEELGLCELDFSRKGTCQIAFFGLTQALTGQGVGRPLMVHANARAVARGAEKLSLHTCTHDHPAALRFYRACGFAPVAREVEVLDDPRLSGLLPRDAAPHVPLIPRA